MNVFEGSPSAPIRRDWIDVTRFGVGRSGTTDVSAAINALPADKILYFPRGDYRLTNTASLFGSLVRIAGDGPGLSRFLCTHVPGSSRPSGYYGFFSMRGSAASSTIALTSNAALGDISVAVGSGHGLVADDIVVLSSSATYSVTIEGSTDKRGEQCKVRSVTSTSVTFWDPILDAYTTASSANLRKITMADRCSVEGVSFENTDPANTVDRATSGLTSFWFCDRLKVTDCDFFGLDGDGIGLETCRDFTVSRVSMRDGADDGYYFSYGVNFRGATQGGTVSDSHFERVRHAVTTAGGTGDSNRIGMPRSISVENCHARSCTGTSFDTHTPGEDIHFRKCHSSKGMLAGFQLRSKSSSVVGCTSFFDASGIRVSRDAHGAAVESNIVRHVQAQNTARSSAFSGDTGEKYGDGIRFSAAANGRVLNNVVEFCAEACISLPDPTANGVLKGNILTNAGRVAAYRAAGIDVANVVTTGLRIEDNTLTQITPSTTWEGQTGGAMDYAIKLAGSNISAARILKNSSHGMVTGFLSDAGTSTVEEGNYANGVLVS